MQNCFIISNNICHVSIDVSGEYDIVIKNIQGILRTPVLKTTDYVKYENSTGSIQIEHPKRDIYQEMTIDTITSMFSYLLTVNKETNQIRYACDIFDCSDRFKYVLGISKLPVKKGEITQSVPFGNGPSFMIVTCDKLTGSGVISPNMYTVDNVFVLQGPGFSGNDLSDLTFRIKGLYNEDIEIESDLLWWFELSKHSANKNTQMRFTNQYR